MEDKGVRLNHGESMSESEYVRLGTGMAVYLWSSSAANLRQMQPGVRSTLPCGRAKSGSFAKGNSSDILSGERVMLCEAKKKHDLLETQRTGLKLRELDPATKKYGYFEAIE